MIQFTNLPVVRAGEGLRVESGGDGLQLNCPSPARIAGRSTPAVVMRERLETQPKMSLNDVDQSPSAK